MPKSGDSSCYGWDFFFLCSDPAKGGQIGGMEHHKKHGMNMGRVGNLGWKDGWRFLYPHFECFLLSIVSARSFLLCLALDFRFLHRFGDGNLGSGRYEGLSEGAGEGGGKM